MFKKLLIFLMVLLFAGLALAFGPQDFQDWKVEKNYGVTMVPPGVKLTTLGICSADFRDEPRAAIIQITKGGKIFSWAYLKDDELVVMGLNPQKGEYVKQPVLPKHEKIIKKALRKLAREKFEKPM